MKQIQGKQGLVRNIGRFVKPRVREIGIPLYIYIYLKTSGHFWKISLSSIPLKLFITEQNLYERGNAAAVVKGRLRAHYFGWILGHLLR